MRCKNLSESVSIFTFSVPRIDRHLLAPFWEMHSYETKTRVGDENSAIKAHNRWPLESYRAFTGPPTTTEDARVGCKNSPANADP
ncbi:hypothetical protein TcasGA2_TC011985 [Tribolium castaneum]|uniref:Uncharacterized protein n=1 Tax=Tribolium castaneum TaxID=7070 RepID=D6X2Q6_TRICA|nr:hypothetical protein TcasGA2_TC011985 [Tribolium castaneum]